MLPITKKDFIILLLSSLLVLLGLFSVFGFVARIPIIGNVGKALVASPFTNPFSDGFSGYSVFDYQFAFLITTENGKTYTLNSVKEMREKMQITPARRNSMYTFQTSVPSEESSIREVLIKHVFCDTDVHRKRLGIPEPIERIDVSITAKRYGVEEEIHQRIICS